jgi:hypothetical protein
MDLKDSTRESITCTYRQYFCKELLTFPTRNKKSSREEPTAHKKLNKLLAIPPLPSIKLTQIGQLNTSPAA